MGMLSINAQINKVNVNESHISIRPSLSVGMCLWWKENRKAENIIAILGHRISYSYHTVPSGEGTAPCTYIERIETFSALYMWWSSYVRYLPAVFPPVLEYCSVISSSISELCKFLLKSIQECNLISQLKVKLRVKYGQFNEFNFERDEGEQKNWHAIEHCLSVPIHNVVCGTYITSVSLN